MKTQQTTGPTPVTSRPANHSHTGWSRAVILTTLLASLALTAFLAHAVGLPNQLEMALHGRPNTMYLVEASADLQHWTIIATNQANPAGVLGFHDPQAGQFPRRYYRGVQVAGASLGQGLSGTNYDPGKILVKPRVGVSLSALNLSSGVSVLNVYPAVGNLQVIKVPPNKTASTLITLYQQSGLVQYAEHDFYVQALTAPDDPHYVNGDLWNMNNLGQYGGTPGADIHATNAWSVITDASSVIVADVDTGVRYTHEDLAANMWVNPADNSHGTNAVAGNTDPNDDFGHGTHVAGTIGAVGNNNLGVVGVCWRVQIMACKFLDTNGNGTIDAAIACIDYARTHGAKIINASWGATSFTSQALHDAIASTRDAGIIFVAAAGNSATDNDTTPLYPASYRDLDNVVAVAATDRNDQLASFSDYGTNSVDLAAPGTPIMSCWNGSDNDYQDDDGTSMSCAHVSGACALVWADHPGETYRQIINRVLAGTDPLPGLQGKTITGGRLDLARALGGTNAPPPTLTANFSASPTSGQAPLTVQFTDTSTGNPTSWNWNFGDGLTGTTQNPNHTYSSAGSFTATLTVANSAGQTNSKSSTITVTNATQSPVTASFSANPTSGQAPLAV
ncbi:MAG TPA: S8 family serine peptidase, partial [Candidatus Acidoferrum sp.]|nr:S8 family serine peptidase [Candidatus Acidoferrum sp.]